MRGEALRTLAAQLREEGSVISPLIVDPAEEPELGLLAASGPRAAAAPEDYELVVEAVREGYLLHYGRPRFLSIADRDLRLLAGDYLYARGIERLAALGDVEAVAELSDLISICAQLHAESRAEPLPLLWRASALAVGWGGGEEHAEAKRGLRAGSPEAESRLRASAASVARAAGIDADLDQA